MVLTSGIAVLGYYGRRRKEEEEEEGGRGGGRGSGRCYTKR